MTLGNRVYWASAQHLKDDLGAAVPDSTRRKKVGKPHKDFPLFPHQRGYWAKKVRGKLHYFGTIANDPSGQAGLRTWLEQRDDLLAGRTPRSTPEDGLTVAELCNHFLTAKEHQRDAGDIHPRTFNEYFANCKFVVRSLGKKRLVDDLAADDFQALRIQMAKRYGIHKLAKEVQLNSWPGCTRYSGGPKSVGIPSGWRR